MHIYWFADVKQTHRPVKEDMKKNREEQRERQTSRENQKSSSFKPRAEPPAVTYLFSASAHQLQVRNNTASLHDALVEREA